VPASSERDGELKVKNVAGWASERRTTTRRKLDYDLIESLTVTDINRGTSDEP
jgi:hypothetical protein